MRNLKKFKINPESFLEILNHLHLLGVNDLSLHSQNLNSSTAFIALNGKNSHGLNFLADAIAAAVPCIIIDAEEIHDARLLEKTLPILAIENLKENLGNFASHFYDHPSQKLSLHAFTGTSGKTSCSQFLAQALNIIGKRCGIIGTLGIGIWPDLTPQINTTPDAVTLQRILSNWAKEGIQHVAMEASSIALDAGRLQACHIRSAFFTNLSQDHLDYHLTMENYARAKEKLFQFPGISAAIINADDPVGYDLLNKYSHRYRCWASSLKNICVKNCENLLAEDIHFSTSGIRANLSYQKNSALLSSALLGKFNVENLLLIAAWLLEHHYSLNEAVDICAKLVPISGRMELLGGIEDAPLIIIDYAHKPDALEKVLLTAQLHCQNELWCVFGCGGNRDTSKRPIMGAIAEKLAHKVIITSDNPRDEDPLAIAKMILSPTANKTKIILDRESAIAEAILQADSQDVILIAGKGHETYQEIKNNKIFFDDALIAKKYLQKRLLNRFLA